MPIPDPLTHALATRDGLALARLLADQRHATPRPAPLGADQWTQALITSVTTDQPVAFALLLAARPRDVELTDLFDQLLQPRQDTPGDPWVERLLLAGRTPIVYRALMRAVTATRLDQVSTLLSYPLQDVLAAEEAAELIQASLVRARTHPDGPLMVALLANSGILRQDLLVPVALDAHHAGQEAVANDLLNSLDPYDLVSHLVKHAHEPSAAPLLTHPRVHAQWSTLLLRSSMTIEGQGQAKTNALATRQHLLDAWYVGEVSRDLDEVVTQTTANLARAEAAHRHLIDRTTPAQMEAFSTDHPTSSILAAWRAQHLARQPVRPSPRPRHRA